MAGILVLVWINGLMAIMRFRAGAVVHSLSPTGILFGSAILAGLGLLALSYASGLVGTFASATVFAVGVCYFWPTMLGVVSERIPRSGALGLGLMGTVGMATVGLITSPQMGSIADRYAHDQLPVEETVEVLRNAQALLGTSTDGDLVLAAEAAGAVVVSATAGSLPPIETANALRAVIATDADEGLVADAQAVLGPADNYGGKISFRYMVPLCGILMLIFGVMYARDRAAGGYRVESLEGSA